MSGSSGVGGRPLVAIGSCPDPIRNPSRGHGVPTCVRKGQAVTSGREVARTVATPEPRAVQVDPPSFVVSDLADEPHVTLERPTPVGGWVALRPLRLGCRLARHSQPPASTSATPRNASSLPGAAGCGPTPGMSGGYTSPEQHQRTPTCNSGGRSRVPAAPGPQTTKRRRRLAPRPRDRACVGVAARHSGTDTTAPRTALVVPELAGRGRRGVRRRSWPGAGQPAGSTRAATSGGGSTSAHVWIIGPCGAGRQPR
jgi:hypothetical protein